MFPGIMSFLSDPAQIATCPQECSGPRRSSAEDQGMVHCLFLLAAEKLSLARAGTGQCHVIQRQQTVRGRWLQGEELILFI